MNIILAIVLAASPVATGQGPDAVLHTVAVADRGVLEAQFAYVADGVECAAELVADGSDVLFASNCQTDDGQVVRTAATAGSRWGLTRQVE